MPEVDQFISAITDEAMQKICYSTGGSGSGWTLKPYEFAISSTDILSGYSDSQIFDSEGHVKPEIQEILKDFTTEKMQQDMNSGNVWCELPFSGVTKPKKESDTLTHHLVVPSNYFSDQQVKQIKTIYFIYRDQNNNGFLYALARATNYMAYETGVTQSFFFNFTVTNSQSIDMTNFIVNYSYPLEIEGHNQSTASHMPLVMRDGSRTLTGILEYEQPRPAITEPNQLVDVQYINDLFGGSFTDYVNESICPPGTLRYWPGQPNTVPEGWAIRNGQLLLIAENPKLYALLGQRYESEATLAGYNKQTHFPLMNDSGLFIRGCEVNSSGTVTNSTYLNGIGFGAKQNCGAPNITGRAQFSQEWETWGVVAYEGAFVLEKRGGNGTDGTRGNFDIVRFDASRCSSVYQNNLNEIRPNNRNYLPIIKLG